MSRRLLLFALLLFFSTDVGSPDPTHCVHGHISFSFLRAFKAAVPRARKWWRLQFRRRGPRALPLPEPGLVMAPSVELQLCKDRTQEHLQPHWIFRAWRIGTMQLVAELPAPLVVRLVEHYLSQAGITAILLDIPRPSRAPLPSAPPGAQPLPVGAPASARARLRLPPMGVPSRAVQEARRRARRARGPGFAS